MTVKIIEKSVETIQINDLMDSVKENPRIIECGAIFSFEGIVRGKELKRILLKWISQPQILRKPKMNFKK